MKGPDLERYLQHLPPEPAPPDLARRIQQRVNLQVARQIQRQHWRHAASALIGTLAAITLLVWAGLETLAAWQIGGVGDFADLFTEHPDLVIRYPLEAVLAFLESLPLANLLLVMGAGLVVVLLAGQLRQVLVSDGQPSGIGHREYRV